MVFCYPRSEDDAIVSGEIKNAYYFTTQLLKVSKSALIISFEEFQEENTLEQNQNLMILRIKAPKSRGVIRYFSRIIYAYRYLKECKINLAEFDIVHSHLTYASWLPILAGQRKVLTTTPHGTNYQEIMTELGWTVKDVLKRINAWCQYKLDSFAMNYSALNLSVSKYQVADMVNFYKCKSPIKIVYNGIDELYHNKEMSKDIDLLFVGRACKKKGLDLVERYAMDHKEQSITMVLGSDMFITLDPSFLNQLSNHSNITVMYSVSEEHLVELYNRSACLIVPSRGYESLPTVIMEAISCGTPVVATNAWGVPEVILNEELRFEEDNYGDMVQTIQYALNRKFNVTDYNKKDLAYEYRQLIKYFEEMKSV